MRIRNSSRQSEKISLQMTPMIDIVFQLLVFFIMSFNIATMEADFNIKMPRSAPQPGEPPPGTPPLRLEINADDSGGFAGMRAGNRSFSGANAFEELNAYVRQRFGSTEGPAGPESDSEVELSFDFNLKYMWIVQAMDAISGYRDHNGQIVRLVEKIKFAPARRAPGE